MNYHNPYLIVLAIIMLMACENNRQTDENKMIGEEAFQNEGSMDGNTDNFSGNDDTINSEIIRQDTTLPGPTHIRIIAELPGKLAEELQIDPELKSLRLINNRSFEEEGIIYYELTFDNQTKLTFDKEGNRQGKP